MREATSGTARPGRKSAQRKAPKRKRLERATAPDGPILVTASRFADLVGAHHNSVGNWIAAEGGLPATRRQRLTLIDVEVGFKWLLARNRREADAEIKALRDDSSGDAAKTRKIQADAHMRELDLAERSGKLIAAEDVEARWAQIADAVREGVLAIPGMAVQAGVVKPADEGALDDICRDTLAALGRRATAPPTDTEAHDA